MIKEFLKNLAILLYFAITIGLLGSTLVVPFSGDMKLTGILFFSSIVWIALSMTLNKFIK